VTLAKLAIGRYGLRDARLRPLGDGVRPGGERSDPRYRTERGLRSPETLRAQLLWLSALRNETDLAVPEPVPLPDGSLGGGVSFADLPPLRSLLRRVSARHRDLYPPNDPPRHFALLRWVPGENKKALPPPTPPGSAGPRRGFTTTPHATAPPTPPRCPAGTGTGRSGRRPRCGRTARSSTRRGRWRSLARRPGGSARTSPS
jgi:hypothetical protein